MKRVGQIRFAFFVEARPADWVKWQRLLLTGAFDEDIGRPALRSASRTVFTATSG